MSPIALAHGIRLAYALAALALVAVAVARGHDLGALLLAILLANGYLYMAGAFGTLDRMLGRFRLGRAILRTLTRQSDPTYVDSAAVAYTLVCGDACDIPLRELSPAARENIRRRSLEVEEACDALVRRGFLEPWVETFHMKGIGPTACATPGLYRLTAAGRRAVDVERRARQGAQVRLDPNRS